jgi:hypothetical protein
LGKPGFLKYLILNHSGKMKLKFSVSAAPSKPKQPVFVTQMAQPVAISWKLPKAPAAAPTGAKGRATVTETTNITEMVTIDLDKMLADADAETTPTTTEEQRHDIGGMGAFLG